MNELRYVKKKKKRGKVFITFKYTQQLGPGEQKHCLAGVLRESDLMNV